MVEEKGLSHDSFFLDTGLRVSELCHIEIKNLNLNEGILKVRGKGEKEREVVLSNRLTEEIRNYLNVITPIQFNKTIAPGLPARGFNLVRLSRDMGIRHGIINHAIFSNAPRLLDKINTFIEEKILPLPIKYLFFNQRGNHLITRHVFRIVREIGEKSGIEKLHPHVLRHSYASALRRKGGDLLLIKEALGHASVSTTEMYAHIGNGEYREKLKTLIN